MRILKRLATSAFWLILPAAAVAALVATAIAGYEPLVFDPAMFEAQKANAVELETIDAEALEAENEANAEPVEVEQAQAPAATASGALADGTWTGYAACGKGNSDNWKPYYVGVTVEVSGGKVSGISKIFGSSKGNTGDSALSWDASENQKYLDWAISGRNGQTGVKAQLSGSSVVSGVDTVSKATYSSAAIYNAYVDALNKSAAAAGSSSVAKAKATSSKKSKKKKAEKVKADTQVGALADGTWTGFAQCGPDPDDDWKAYYTSVTLTVKDAKVVSIDDISGTSTGDSNDVELSWDSAENQSYLTWAIAGRTLAGVTYKGVKEQIETALEGGSNPSSIDTVSGATFSSQSIFKAFYNALEKSAAAAGSSVESPEEQPASVDDVKESDAGSDSGNAADESAVTGEGIEIAGSFDDGTYSGYALCESDAEWTSYYVVVDIVAKGGLITSIANVKGDNEGLIDEKLVYSAAENGTYLNRAIRGVGKRLGVVEQIQNYLDKKMNVGSIDTVSKATISSKAIYAAFENAVAAARGETEQE